jgi:hypothetical protein
VTGLHASLHAALRAFGFGGGWFDAPNSSGQLCLVPHQ